MSQRIIQLINKIESLIDFRDDNDDTYQSKVRDVLDEVLMVKPDELNKMETEKLNAVLERFDASMEDRLSETE